ncbi:MAG: hypothetical protein U9Q78_01495 [Chloroflexota bacterium]|nr:hypothetical protein [Chloroflexota bacterium]
MDRKTFLKRAQQHIFSTGLNDSGCRLGLANMKYGLAKIHWVQQEMGLEPNATFISAPDMTITRNTNRWKSGFGYGGKVRWGDGHLEMVILDLKPNTCGMLVGGLKSMPDGKDLIVRAHRLKNEVTHLDDVELEWDLGKSNHFIDLFQVEPLVGQPFPPYAFVLHFAGGEMRSDGPWGEGIYWDFSPTLRRKARVFETPFGPLRVLTGEEAVEYYQSYRRAEAFSKRRRLLAADWLFGEYELINNDTHQGLIGLNEMVLGSYIVEEDVDKVLPIALRPDMPAYLVRGKPNFRPEVVEILGFDKRARRLGVYEQLTSANIVPHGGGYVFPHIMNVLAVHEIEDERYFEVDLRNGQGREFITSIREIPYEYRGRQVVLRAVELGMVKLVARLTPVYILKV